MLRSRKSDTYKRRSRIEFDKVVIDKIDFLGFQLPVQIVIESKMGNKYNLSLNDVYRFILKLKLIDTFGTIPVIICRKTPHTKALELCKDHNIFLVTKKQLEEKGYVKTT